MKVLVKGHGEVTLSQADFVAEGGQASVFAKNGTAYKVYADPKDSIPELKFQELSKIRDANVIRPESLLLDPRSQAPIGYAMRFIQDAYALCQLFPKSFRTRNGVGPEDTRRIVDELKRRVEAVHSAGVLVVDMNEMNALARKDLSTVYMIDVDSYQTKSFRCDVIMPSVRDWSVKPPEFSESSDWFSFAVLAFQLYVGLHPYRGSHADAKHVPPDARMEYRMRNALSAFGAGAKLPRACYPIDSIPARHRVWLEAVLEHGERTPPPDASGATVAVAEPTTPVFGGSLQIAVVADFDAAVIDVLHGGGTTVVVTATSIYVDGRRVQKNPGPSVEVGITGRLSIPFVLHGRELRPLSKAPTEKLTLQYGSAKRCGTRVLLQTRASVEEVDPVETRTGIAAVSFHRVANCTEHSTRLFEGCAVQQMAGSTFVSLFPRRHAGHQLRMPELEKRKLVDAKFDGGVMMTITHSDGKYRRSVFRFSEDLATYEVQHVDDVSPSGLNFVTLDSGVCVSLTEDETLEVFPSRMGASSKRVVSDDGLGGDMRLVKLASGVGFIRGNTVCSMSMR